ncbi:MAG TPA: adenosylcobinamide-phosphate synthase CbiB [Victivallales bacterium]|nr:adenosylcobinamide-phosphate synthase CbiB [Victivallales bacterium]
MIELFSIFLLAFVFDFIIGDPHFRYHPVSLLGNYADKIEILCRSIFGDSFISGMFCSIIIIFTSMLLACALVYIGFYINYYTGIIISSICLYITIAPHSLISHASAIEKELRKKNFDQARKKVAMIVSRDTDALDKQGIIRSCIESLSENIIDGVTSALFFAVLGYIIAGPIGLAAGAFFLRSANTLDAMFGYKNERYIRFGTFPARLDDILHYIPARLTVLAVFTAALLGKMRAVNAVKCAINDHDKHPSPNSAWGMAAFAGALGVRLGGPTQYKNVLKNYPYWGIKIETLDVEHISKAKTLVILTSFSFTIIILALSSLVILV